jgi:hypothetical protein
MTTPSGVRGMREQGSPRGELVTDFRPETILQLEFEHARARATQALDHRVKVASAYLFLAAALGVGGLALVLVDENRLPTISDIDGVIGPAGHTPGIVFALIYWGIGLAGFFAFLHLIRLRQTAHDSLRAMNRIKEFYVLRFPQLAEALTWRAETMPALGRVGSLTFYLALLIALVDSLMVGAGLVFIDIKSSVPTVDIAAGAAVLAFLWQTLVYFVLLREK